MTHACIDECANKVDLSHSQDFTAAFFTHVLPGRGRPGGNRLGALGVGGAVRALLRGGAAISKSPGGAGTPPMEHGTTRIFTYI